MRSTGVGPIVMYSDWFEWHSVCLTYLNEAFLDIYTVKQDKKPVFLLLFFAVHLF